METVENGNIRFVEFQWCVHVAATPLELRGARMLLVEPSQTAVMTSGRSICIMCMLCLADWEKGKLTHVIQPNPNGSLPPTH